MAALNVSSRNVTPTPSVPPTAFREAGVHALPFIISANRASRTRDDLAFLGQARTRPGSRTPFGPCSSRRRFREVCRRPAQTPPALSGHGRCRRDRPPPSSGLRRRRISSSRMKRITAIQKSSRTMTTHCTRPPSHCRRACTSSVFCSSFLACSHCSNWSRTISTFLPDGNALPTAQCRQRLFQTQVVGQGRTALAQAVQQPGFRLLGGRFDVDGDHVVGQPGQQARLHQRRLAAPGRPVDQAHRERVVGVRLLDAGLPEPDAVGQSVPITRARAAVRGRSRRRGRRTTASLSARS